jgi:hypothetical protein
MRQFAALFVLLLVLIFSLTAARGIVAQDTPATQFGDFHFNVPSGWNPTEKGGAFLMVVPPPNPGSTTFIALATNDLDGDIQKSLDKFWQGFQSSYRSIQKGPLVPTPVKNVIETLSTTAVAIDQTGKPWNMTVTCARYGNRLETVLYMSDLSTGATYNAYFKIFQDFRANLTIGEALPGSKIPAADAAQPDQETPQQFRQGRWKAYTYDRRCQWAADKQAIHFLSRWLYGLRSSSRRHDRF